MDLFNTLLLIAIFGTLIFFIFRKKNLKYNPNQLKSINRNQPKPINRTQPKPINRNQPKLNNKIQPKLIRKPTENVGSSTYELKISKEKKNELFKKLIQFEESKGYLEKNLTLTKVAHQLGINTKYLSHIIKLHSDRDFNNYINLLRIQYIVNQLEENPKLHQYKISALAEEAGFSSHSKFAHFFKLNIGVTPSNYIAYLKEINA